MDNEERVLTRYDSFNLSTIPADVTSIGEKAFAFHSGLTSITILKGVKSIGYGAFQDCDNLTIRTTKGSYAARWAIKNGIKVETI